MSKFTEQGFAERRTSAADAKKALLDKYKAGTASEELAQKLAERAKIVAARDARNAEKEAARREREAEEARIRAELEAQAEVERLEREAAEAAERAAREAARPRQLIRDAALYAARKASGSRR